MKVLVKDWEEIREQFSEAEKESLRSALVTTTLCPPAQVIQNNLIKKELLKKLEVAVERLNVKRNSFK